MKWNNMFGYHWFIIGLHVWVFPPEPAVGDFIAMRNWKPVKLGIWTCLKLRWTMRFWGYTITSEEIQNENKA